MFTTFPDLRISLISVADITKLLTCSLRCAPDHLKCLPFRVVRHDVHNTSLFPGCLSQKPTDPKLNNHWHLLACPGVQARQAFPRLNTSRIQVHCGTKIGTNRSVVISRNSSAQTELTSERYGNLAAEQNRVSNICLEPRDLKSSRQCQEIRLS